MDIKKRAAKAAPAMSAEWIVSKTAGGSEYFSNNGIRQEEPRLDIFYIITIFFFLNIWLALVF
jgi:hypothetical protein